MFWSSLWRSMTLAELWSIRSISIRLEVDMRTTAFGCSLIVTGRLPMWSRWQWVTMIRSRFLPRRGAWSGAARRPTFFGCRPESIRMLRSPSCTNSELAPMPPSRFRSVSFISWPYSREAPRTTQAQRPGPQKIHSARHDKVEGRQEHVDLRPRLVDPVEPALDVRVAAGHVVAVVGELLAGRE